MQGDKCAWVGDGLCEEDLSRESPAPHLGLVPAHAALYHERGACRFDPLDDACELVEVDIAVTIRVGRLHLRRCAAPQ